MLSCFDFRDPVYGNHYSSFQFKPFSDLFTLSCESLYHRVTFESTSSLYQSALKWIHSLIDHLCRNLISLQAQTAADFSADTVQSLSVAYVPKLWTGSTILWTDLFPILYLSYSDPNFPTLIEFYFLGKERDT